MARTKATTLLTHTDKTCTTDIVSADNIYVLNYNNEPFGVRIQYHKGNQTDKYLKIAYNNAGPAFALAEKLNNRFNTQDFTVNQVHTTETIDRSEYELKYKLSNTKQALKTMQARIDELGNTENVND